MILKIPETPDLKEKDCSHYGSLSSFFSGRMKVSTRCNFINVRNIFKCFVNYPASPQDPSPVIVNSRGQGNRHRAVIERDLHIPSGIHVDESFDLLYEIFHF